MEKDPLILLIDDEPQILRALKTILTGNHFRVITAPTGEQGLALAATQSPDVIILDLTLPDMDGIRVCEEIREWSRTPIIYDEEDLPDRTTAVGCLPLLVSPTIRNLKVTKMPVDGGAGLNLISPAVISKLQRKS